MFTRSHFLGIYMANNNFAQLMQNVRDKYSISQADLAAILGVTTQYISRIENAKKRPSELFIRCFCYFFGLEITQTMKSAGIKNSRFDYEALYKITGASIIGTSVAGLAFPVATGTILAGLGAAAILTKIQQAYGARTQKELAEKHLGVTPTTLSNWKARGEVPKKYLIKAAQQNHLPAESFQNLHDEKKGSILSRLVAAVEEQILNSNSRLTPKRKGLLIDILYERFKETGRIDIDQINHMISVLIDSK